MLLIGVGGLGCPAALYLAAAGVGTMGLMDGDTVSLLNLHRQILYTNSEIGMPKVTCAANALHRCNSSVTIQTYPVMADADNLPELVRQYDIVLDCTDHLPTKFLINDVCVAERVAYVHGGILAYQGRFSPMFLRKRVRVIAAFLKHRRKKGLFRLVKKWVFWERLPVSSVTCKHWRRFAT